MKDTPFTPTSESLIIGQETLRRMASVDRYNHWIYDEIKGYLGARVLEVGCGIGNMTRYFLDRELCLALDLLAESVALVRHQYAEHTNLLVWQGDITDGDLIERLLSFRFDTVVCVNVLEHIKDDALALHHMCEVLQPDGYLLLVVPAGQYLYGTLDQALGHYRRYQPESLERLVRGQGFQIHRLYHFNLAGILGWFLNSRILGRRVLPEGQLALFDGLTPLFIAVERALQRVGPLPIGQCLVCVASK